MALLASAAVGALGGLFIGSKKKSSSSLPAPAVSSPDGALSSPSGEDEEGIKKARGRLALLATGPQGVLGSAPVGRRKILGN